jgi:hypothetical protein
MDMTSVPECQGCGVYIFIDFSDEGHDICSWCGLGTHCCCECGLDHDEPAQARLPKQCSRCGHIGTDVIDRLRGYVDKPFRWVVECENLRLCAERYERKKEA